MVEELVDGMELRTLSGQTLTIHLMGNGVVVFAPNDGSAAAITTANILACKSVIHIIDTILVTGACFHFVVVCCFGSGVGSVWLVPPDG
jgi:uncharacterized surface protein with fasciclin (FAS1) repeats